MTKKFVYAVYDSIGQGDRAVEALKEAGIPGSSLALVADDQVLGQSSYFVSDIDSQEVAADQQISFFGHSGKFLHSSVVPAGQAAQEANAQPVEDPASKLSNVDLSTYQEELDAGKVLVVVDSNYEAEALAVNSQILSASPATPANQPAKPNLQGSEAQDTTLEVNKEHNKLTTSGREEAADFYREEANKDLQDAGLDPNVQGSGTNFNDNEL